MVHYYVDISRTVYLKQVLIIACKLNTNRVDFLQRNPGTLLGRDSDTCPSEELGGGAGDPGLWPHRVCV